MIYLIVAMFLAVLAMGGVINSFKNTDWVMVGKVILSLVIAIVIITNMGTISIPNTIYITIPNLAIVPTIIGGIVIVFITTMVIASMVYRKN